MKNYNFETRPLTLEEKTSLENDLAGLIKGEKIGLVSTFGLPSVAYLWGIWNESDLLENLFLRIVAALFTALIFAPFIWLFFRFLKRKITKDLVLEKVFIANAKLYFHSLMPMIDDDDNVGFHYRFNNEIKYIRFRLMNKTLISLKTLENPIEFEDLGKEALEKALEKGRNYRLTFALNTEHLFSMEEIE